MQSDEKNIDKRGFLTYNELDTEMKRRIKARANNGPLFWCVFLMAMAGRDLHV